MAGNLYFALGRASVLDFRRFTQSAIIIMSLLTFARVAIAAGPHYDEYRQIRLKMIFTIFSSCGSRGGWGGSGCECGTNWDICARRCNFFTSNWCIPVDKLTSMEDNWKIRLASRSKIVWELAAEKSWMWYAWLKTWHKFFKKKKKSPTYLSEARKMKPQTFELSTDNLEMPQGKKWGHDPLLPPRRPMDGPVWFWQERRWKVANCQEMSDVVISLRSCYLIKYNGMHDVAILLLVIFGTSLQNHPWKSGKQQNSAESMRLLIKSM